MKKITFVFLSFMSLNLPMIVQAEEGLKLIDTQKLCEEQDQYRCLGACKDGWGTACYYDGSQVQLESGRSLDSQKSKCYGFYDSSSCKPCRRVYEIDGKTVQCREFYDAINRKNKECKGCMKDSFTGGG